MARHLSLGNIGAIASILGFIAATCMILFTEYKVAALISLLIAETIVVAVFWYYSWRKNSVIHPYKREDLLSYSRYCFHSPTKISYEVTEVFRVTEPFLDNVEINLTWTGRGKIKATSDLLPSEILPEFDSQTGKIHFNLPLRETKRFGETAITHYKLELEDDASRNLPQLSKNVKRPCRMIIYEVILRYLDDCPEASLSWRNSNDSHLSGHTNIATIPFDKDTKSFRAVISEIAIGRLYQLTWKPPGVQNAESGKGE